MVIKGNGAVNTMEAVKINTKEKERTKVTYHKSVFSSVLTGITWGAAILALAVLVFLVGFILIRGVKNLTLEQLDRGGSINILFLSCPFYRVHFNAHNDFFNAKRPRHLNV